MKQDGTELAHYKFLVNWEPQVGDFVIYHGWVYSRWYGVVSSISRTDHTVTVVKSGLPVLLLNLSPDEHAKNQEVIPIADIRNSVGGKYAAFRAVGNNVLWFI